MPFPTGAGPRFAPAFFCQSGAPLPNLCAVCPKTPCRGTAVLNGQMNHTTSVIFLDDSEELRLQPIFANSSENVSGLESDLTPRKGQSAENPWQRHGSTPPKEPRPVRAPSPFGAIPNSASSWGALTRAYCLSRTKPMAWPWAAGSLPLRGEKTPVKMKGWYQALWRRHTGRHLQHPLPKRYASMENHSRIRLTGAVPPGTAGNGAHAQCPGSLFLIKHFCLLV
jgi:hypothetical protein